MYILKNKSELFKFIQYFKFYLHIFINYTITLQVLYIRERTLFRIWTRFFFG